MRQHTLNIRISVYWASDDVNKLTPYERMAGGASYVASKLKFLCVQYSSVLFLRNSKVFFKNRPRGF